MAPSSLTSSAWPCSTESASVTASCLPNSSTSPRALPLRGYRDLPLRRYRDLPLRDYRDLPLRGYWDESYASPGRCTRSFMPRMPRWRTRMTVSVKHAAVLAPAQRSGDVRLRTKWAYTSASAQDCRETRIRRSIAEHSVAPESRTCALRTQPEVEPPAHTGSRSAAARTTLAHQPCPAVRT